jgi:hypothetical protein
MTHKLFYEGFTVPNCGSTTFLILTFLAWLMLWIFFVEEKGRAKRPT